MHIVFRKHFFLMFLMTSMAVVKCMPCEQLGERLEMKLFETVYVKPTVTFVCRHTYVSQWNI
jgi:hypothetical protein